jgi:predicted transcriptional regulator
MSIHAGVQPMDSILKRACEIVSAYVSHNPLPSGELPSLIKSVFAMLATLDGSIASEQTQLKPAVPIKKSVTDGYIVCLEDGRKMKMLKRYLRSHYDMSPDDYRAKWGLPLDYPMVAPSYAHLRSEFAKKIGLGKVRNSSKGRRRS